MTLCLWICCLGCYFGDSARTGRIGFISGSSSFNSTGSDGAFTEMKDEVLLLIALLVVTFDLDFKPKLCLTNSFVSSAILLNLSILDKKSFDTRLIWSDKDPDEVPRSCLDFFSRSKSKILSMSTVGVPCFSKNFCAKS